MFGTRRALVTLATLALASCPLSSGAAEPDSSPDVTVARDPGATAVPLETSATPPPQWNDLGCVGCHGDDGPYRDEIRGALGKPVAQVARWIRDAPSIKPDTDMPSFAGQIDEPTSIALATWVQDLAAHRQ